MTQAEVKYALMKLRFLGKYSFTKIAKEAGLAHDTVRRAFNGDMSAKTQVRLEHTIKILPAKQEKPKSKRKPGHRKMAMIRYLNLKAWIAICEEHHGKIARFKVQKHHTVEYINSGYIGCKLDYMLKVYLLEIFGEELKKKKITMGDCFAAEQWILNIKKALPGYKKDLIERLISRRKKK